MLTDNIAALGKEKEIFVVQPGVPRILLRPPSVEALWGTVEALPKMLGTWDKRSFDLIANHAFHDRAAPLRAIYILDFGSEEIIRFSRLGGTEALVHLTANTYLNYLLDARQQVHDFMTLSQLVRQVPVRRIQRPDDLSRLPAICELILEDFAQTGTAEPEGALV